MTEESFNASWENNKYGPAKQSGKFPYNSTNRYPYDLVVSMVARKFFKLSLEQRKEIKVLDLGCGSGNNAKFLAENGFDVYGIDGSKAAIEICEERFASWNLKAEFVKGDFMRLPYDDGFFDLVIDRESLYANKFEHIKTAIKQVNKKLKHNGLFLSFIYSSCHPDKEFGEMIEPNTYDNFKQESSFYKAGVAHFTDIREIYELYSEFKIENIMRHSLIEVYNKSKRFMEFDEYVIIASKI